MSAAASRGMIGVDWGTTNVRAFLFDGLGAVVDRRLSDRGAARLAAADFADELVRLTDGWTRKHIPLILAGMVGGRAGWREAPYVPCPADETRLAAAAVRLDTGIGQAIIVPGVSARDESGAGSVMRGEETQLVGAGVSDGTVVLPGTHSKWATIEDGRITGLSTAMTGELFAVLRSHSLLAQLAVTDAPFDPDSFQQGVERALAAGTIVPLLFSARADVLLGDLSAAAVESYLSGLLIGGEIAAFGARPVTLIGGSTLVDRYRAAFRMAGVEDIVAVDGEEAVSRGLWKIGAMA